MAHSSKNISLAEYLTDVDKGNILVPHFQRNFVWTKSQMIKLAASLLKGYPIGSFLLMQDTGEYCSRRITGLENDEDESQNEGEHQIKQRNSLLILDGQQRTTTAYQIFYGKGKWRFYFDYKRFCNDIEDKGFEKIEDIVEDNIEEWLVALPGEKSITNPDEQKTRGLFPLDIILNGSNNQDYSQWLDTYSSSNALKDGYQLDMEKFSRLSRNKSIFIRQLIEKITGYQASEIVIDKDTSPNIVCTIFETINSTGQKLTILDLLNAKCFAEGFMLRTELDIVLDNNDNLLSFEDEKESVIGLAIIRTIGLLCRKSCKKSDLLALKASEIKKYWKEAVGKIVNAIQYVEENYGVRGIKYFPYKDILPVIAVITNHIKFDKDNKNKLKFNCWYWNVVFSGYFDNATESKNTKALKELLGTEKEKGWFDDDSQLPEVVSNNEYTTKSFDSLDKIASTQSALYKAIHNLIVLNSSQDFSSDRRRISSYKENELQDHHIFTKKFLALHGIKGVNANTILNRTLISKSANQTIKDKPPFEYFYDKNIVGNSFSTQELSRHCINKITIEEPFTKESYIKFKEERKKLIVELILQRVSVDSII